MQTIRELNSKIWYRALKVIYVLIFISILVVSALIVVDNFAPKFDDERSYIKCDNGKTFHSETLKDNNIDIPLKKIVIGIDGTIKE